MTGLERTHDITDWADRIERAIERIRDESGWCCVSNVFVYQRVSSTQDAAFRHRTAGGGVAALASLQTAGRGRMGRRWDDGEALTLPMSVAFESKLDDVALAARAGLAALDACADRCTHAQVLIKWPNDVVVRAPDGDRKLAGVLIERRDGVVIAGIGINVFAGDASSSDAASGYKAVSLQALGVDADRCDLAIGVIERLSWWLRASDDAVRARWSERDAMLGTERAFVADAQTIEGTVIALDPLRSITVRSDSGDRELPVVTARTV